MAARPKTLVDKVWEAHVVRSADGEPDLLFIDLHLVHEVTSPQAFDGLRLSGRGVRRPDLTVATADHNVPTTRRRRRSPTQSRRRRSRCSRPTARSSGSSATRWATPTRASCTSSARSSGSRQPGMTIVCGDSHTSTHGALRRARLRHRHERGRARARHPDPPPVRPATMAVTVDGELPAGVTAKDIVLAIIGRIGTGGGMGHVIEYRGLGDPRALHGRANDRLQHDASKAARGRGWWHRTTPRSLTSRAAARAQGKDMGRGPRLLAGPCPTDKGAAFDKQVALDAASLAPHVTWGTNPAQ